MHGICGAALSHRHCAACEPALKNAHVEGLDFIGKEGLVCNPCSNIQRTALVKRLSWRRGRWDRWGGFERRI
ncbi:MAG: hypothetical protein KJ714_05330 [Euryarchaeota archaeon]|nr:hypothetical protein [Euryarchaeota archaeon]